MHTVGVVASTTQKHIATRFTSGEYVNCGASANLNFSTTNPFSLSCWFKTVIATTGVMIIRRAAGPTFAGYAFSVAAGGVRFNRIHDAGANQRAQIDTTAVTFADGNWHHAVATTTAGTLAANMNIYVDAVLQPVTATFNTLITDITGANTTYLGRDTASGSSPFQGDLDEAAVYNITLSAGQVSTLYNGGNPPDLRQVGPFGNLVSYWRMGEGATFPTIPDAADGNPGTMVGMAASDFVYWIP
jgi:hypothetical protein